LLTGEKKTFFTYGEKNVTQGVYFEVQNRTREVLIPLIQRFVQPGSIITTYEARVYSSLGVLEYVNKVVSHKRYEFVNRVTTTTTKHVESYW
jgi:hypothetical protein